MGALGDVLELAATCSQRWGTISATVTHRVNPVLQQVAIERNQPEFLAKRSTPPGDPGTGGSAPSSGERTDTYRLRAANPGRCRVEGAPAEGAQAAYLFVRDGDRQWQRTTTGEVFVADHSAPGVPVFGPLGGVSLLDPEQIIAGQTVTPLGESVVGGRAALRARLTPKGDRSRRVMTGRGIAFMPGWFGDETVIDLDTATGAVLRLESTIDGQPMMALLLDDVTIDEPIDESIFSELPPTDATVRESPVTPEPIETLAGTMAFTLYVPADRRCHGLKRPGRAGTPTVVQLFVLEPMFLRPGMSPPLILESDDPSAVADPTTWAPVDLTDGTGWIWEPDGGGEVHLRTERDGTHIWVRGLHDRDGTIALANTLRPVPHSGPTAAVAGL